MSENNNKGSGIPIGLIVVAWILYAPAGLVLTIIKCLPLLKELFSSSSSNQQNRNQSSTTTHYSSTYSQNSGTVTHYASTYNKPNTNQAYYQPTGTNTAESVSNNHQINHSQASSQATQNNNSSKKASAKERKFDKSKFLKILGYILLGLASLVLIGGIPDMFTLDWVKEVLPAALTFALGGGALVAGGTISKNRSTRLATIRLLVGEHESYNLAKLAAAVGTSIKQIRRDVQYLIDHGEYGKLAYIDNATDNFMKTPDAKADDPAAFDYKTLYGNTFKKKNKENGETAEAPEEVDINTDNEDYKEIIREIRRLNDEIKDEAVSERIFKIEDLTKSIFEYVSAHPDSKSKIRTFLNYYLPTTLKLLESYSQIEKVGVAGENMQKSKDNIESTLDMLVTAFKLQIDDLFKSESIDISTDISVLETMMNKDGLSGKNDFDTAAFTDEIKDEIQDYLAGGGAAAQMPEEK